jgi:hypothetical protein
MPTVFQDLEETLTARWYRSAPAPAQAVSWSERRRCYQALAGNLVDHPPSREAGQRVRQPAVHLRGLLSEVAQRAGFASAETVYKRWREPSGDRPDQRWSGHDPPGKPRAAFVLEAKIVAFWPYREGALQVADPFEMSLTEIAASYYRALAAWAADAPALAACEPAGSPRCVQEDMEILVRRFARACPSAVEEAPIVSAAGDRLFGSAARHDVFSRRHEGQALLIMGELERGRACLECALVLEAGGSDNGEYRGSGPTHLLLSRVRAALGNLGDARGHVLVAIRLLSRDCPGGSAHRDGARIGMTLLEYPILESLSTYDEGKSLSYRKATKASYVHRGLPWV